LLDPSAINPFSLGRSSVIKSQGTIASLFGRRPAQIGGIRYAGVITDEETAFDALRKAPDADERFRRLLREATIKGQMLPFLDCDRSARRTTKRKLIATGKALAKSILAPDAKSDRTKCRLPLENGSTRWHLSRSNQAMKPTAPLRSSLGAGARYYKGRSISPQLSNPAGFNL